MEEKTGAWTDFVSPITSDQKKIWDEAIQGLLGVQYTPIACASQLVAGTNYIFICLAKVIYPGSSAYIAQVDVFKPLSDKAYITQIVKIAPANK
jgi:hypothetical protein